MKRNAMLRGVLAGVVIAGLSGVAMAGPGPGGGFGGPPPDMALGAGGFEGRLAKVLKLSDAQQSQIKALRDAAREQDKALLDKLREGRILLMRAAEATTFDEAAVRTLAADQATSEAALIVSRTKLQSQIYALLSADQRELLKNLRPDMDRQPPPEAK